MRKMRHLDPSRIQQSVKSVHTDLTEHVLETSHGTRIQYRRGLADLVNTLAWRANPRIEIIAPGS